MRAVFLLSAALAATTALAHEPFDFDFERHDVDNDGELSEMEWQEADFVTTSFVSADTDNNGAIDREEARAVAEAEEDRG